MPRKLFTKITSLSKYDNVILQIVGSHGATFEKIRADLRSRSVFVSCLEALLCRLVASGMLKEDTYGIYRRGECGYNVRKCLCCSDMFASEGTHNRVCDMCKNKNEWKMGA